MSCYPSLETHPLKVLKSTENLNSQKVVLGPPDVYQQEPKQKEDILSECNVREGFNCSIAVTDEHESGKELGLDFVSRPFLMELNNYMQAVIVKNHNNNIKPDTTKRKATVAAVYKDLQCMPAIDKSKEITYEWMLGLCDTLPYAELIIKRIPYFHKKEDVLKEMNRYQVPITRAIWFIKVSSMHTTIQAESNKKKTRSSVDSSSDWVAVLGRVLSDKLDLVAEKLHSNSLDHEYELSISEFEYFIRLMVAMYDEDLLDHQEVLQWIVNRCDRCDEPLMQFYLPFLLQFGDRFKENEILTRKLLWWCCRMFSSLVSGEEKSAVISTGQAHAQAHTRSLTDQYCDYSSCAMHRNVLFCLSGLITSLSLLCPSSVIWNNVKQPDHFLDGSPLDYLPCSLTAMPSPPGPENESMRETLAKLEQFVMQRSVLVENQWRQDSFDSEAEHTAASVVRALDILDKYDYNFCKETTALDTLSQAVVGSLEDRPLLLLVVVCEWATTPIRTGLHRPLVAVSVLDCLRTKCPTQALQASLVHFLDTRAPVIDCTSPDQEPFRNLVCLFGELIERELFSVDDYVSYMIKRGIFEQCPMLPLAGIGGQIVAVDRSPDQDRNSCENPDSVRSECSGAPGQGTQAHQVSPDYRHMNRHLQYLAQFPVPNNEDYAHEHNLRAQKLYGSTKTRDANKQFLKKLVKDIGRFFTKRANMFDVVQMGGAVGGSGGAGMSTTGTAAAAGDKPPRKKPRREGREARDHEAQLLDKLTESVLARYRCLSYHDMEVVMGQVVGPMAQAFNLGSLLAAKNQSLGSLYLPYPRVVNTLLSMVEYSCNYQSLVLTIDECLVNLSKLVEQLLKHGTGGSGPVAHGSLLATYCTNFRAHVIGFLLKYHSVLMLMNESRGRIFHVLFYMVYNPSLTAGNTPSYINRCTFALISTIYQSCALIKSNRLFQSLNKKMTRVVEPDRVRSAAAILYDETYVADLIRGASLPSTERYSSIIVDMQANIQARFSFVVNCLLHMSRCQDTDQLIRINTMIVETAANVPSLPAELMTALFSLLMPFNALPGYGPFKDQFSSLLVSLGSDMIVYDNIAVLIATLLARQTFTFCDFLSRVICVAMAQGLEQQSPVSPEIVPTTRLASYILHRLFTMDSVTPAFTNIGPFKLEDINLLTSSLQKVTTELLVDLLKMLAVHSDKGRLQDQDFVGVGDIGGGSVIPKRARDLTQPGTATTTGMDDDTNYGTMKIWNLTLRVLREICCVSWVRIKFSMETPSRLIRDNVLIDKNISNSQARNLLSIICAPREHVWQNTSTSRDIIDTMDRTLEGLSLWSLHFDQMKIQLLLTQIPDDERKDIFDSVSRDTINLFQGQAEQQIQSHNSSVVDSSGGGADDNGGSSAQSQVSPPVSLDISAAYLIPPLINKLPFDQLKRQLINAAAERLESGKHFSSHKNYQDKEKDLTKSSLILTYPPFVSLLVSCLASRDEHRHDFLKSLSDQIEYYIENAKETEKMPDDLRVKHLIHTSLTSRLALVGHLFDRIQESMELCSDWAVLLSKLIIYGVVEMQSDHTQLFYTVLDMIGTLIHTMVAQQSLGTRFSQTSKKLRKEISDKSNYEGVELIKPLLLSCVKNTYDVVVTVPLRMPHKSQQFRPTSNERSGKQGCAIQRKERLNPWEVIEGVKNLFSLSWFAAVSCETPVLPIEEQANLMIGHDHPDKVIRSDSYYTAYPDIPAEDIKDQAAMELDLVMGGSDPPSVPPVMCSSSSGPPGPPLPMDMAGGNPTSVKAESIVGGGAMGMQPLQRSHSNASTASSEVSATKRTKRTKRAAQSTNIMNQGGHGMPRNVTSPRMMPGNQAMMMRHAVGQGQGGGGVPMGPMYPQYPSHGLEYGQYPAHPMSMHVDIQQQQQQGFMQQQQHQQQQQQRAAYPQQNNPYDNRAAVAAANATMMRQNRMPRSDVTQNLKTKLQQRQPQQMLDPQPPPYRSNASVAVLEDMQSAQQMAQQMAPQPNYGPMGINTQPMNTFQRQYQQDPGMQPMPSYMMRMPQPYRPNSQF